MGDHQWPLMLDASLEISGHEVNSMAKRSRCWRLYKSRTENFEEESRTTLEKSCRELPGNKC